MSPMLCPECRSPIALPDCCSHATCCACGLILEEFPALDGFEALNERSNTTSDYRTRIPSGTLGRWQRLRFLQRKIDWEVARLAKVRAHLRDLKAALAIPIFEDGILSLFTRIIPKVRAKRIHISPEALISVLLYTCAKSYGLPIDFAEFSTQAGLSKHRLFRLLSRLSYMNLGSMQIHSNTVLRRQTSLGILEKITARFDLPPPIVTSAHDLLSRRQLSVIPRICVMASLLVAVHRCKAAGMVTKRVVRLQPIYRALHVSPSTAYKIGRDHQLLASHLRRDAPSRAAPFITADRQTSSEFF